MVEFIFFLTYSDVTVYNALEIFEELQDTGVKYIGFKDVGLPKEKLVELHNMIKGAGKTSVLEIVSATKEDNIRSVKAGLELGVDFMIGGTFVEETLPLVKVTKTQYFPYIGRIVGHPCLLRGTIKEIVEDAKRVEALGVKGIDLLAYRYDGDVEGLIKSVNSAVGIPVIVAGSISSLERVRKVAELGAWGFTIGSAIFDKKFVPEGTLKEQIAVVLGELKKIGN